MTFNSIEFLFFALIFFSLWPWLNKKDTSRWIFLTGMSFVFYGWWNWKFLFLIIASGLLDFFCGILMRKQPARAKFFLILSLAGNLGSLVIFKYNVFIADVLESIISFSGLSINLKEQANHFSFALPVGISFYTFQSMSYTIDVYKKRIEPATNILHFFSFLSMFPQLVAGPIVRAKYLLRQLKEERKSSITQKWHALKLIVYGLFQKMVIADNLAYFVDMAYENKSVYDGTLFWWVTLIAFAFQIYCDFSGYSLIAKGLAKYMGYHFKMNFNHPYLSRSLKDFWQRWHISLSTWFRDYVYIPLGGSKKGMIYGILFMSISLLLSGIWHGANYTFIAWGLLHALFLALERITGWPQKLHFRVLCMTLIFLQVTLAWNYFRAENIQQANEISRKLFSGLPTNWEFLSFYFDNLVFLLLAIGIEITVFFKLSISTFASLYKKNNWDIITVAASLTLLIFFRGEGGQFIYFQF